MSEEQDATFSSDLGGHLRRLRKQKGLSLLEVEATSGKEFKASVLGAYERGERAISVPRLARLAQLYGVPLEAMVPRGASRATEGEPLRIALDAERLERSGASEAQVVARYVRAIRSLRGEWAGRVIRLRSDDLLALACALDLTPEELVAKLEEIGVRAY